MKYRIKFYHRKMEILTDDGEVARYYSDLMYATFEDPYCWLHFADGAKYRAEVSLLYLLKNLPPQPFFRCNRTSLINICYYVEYKKSRASIIMNDGTEFKLSVRNIANFQKQKTGLKRISPPCPPCSNCKNESCPDFGLFCLPPNQHAAEKNNGKKR